MKTDRIVSVIGARPNIIKMAPIHRQIVKTTNHSVVHTGQQYDYAMSEIFFKEFDLPKLAFNLDVGSGTGNYQIGEMILRLEKVYLKVQPDLALVYGDTNSTLAGALSAIKCGISVGHVEAGLRSFDRLMPEEINRVITDHINEYLFAPTDTSIDNLKKENVHGKVFNTGDISVEIVDDFIKRESRIFQELMLHQAPYLLLTIHRAENTNSPDILRSIVNAIQRLNQTAIVFPIHPRTKKVLNDMGLLKNLESSPNIRLIPPLGYLDIIKLIENASKVVTDSGGVQKEAYLLGTPCVTLRENTEWVETVSENWNTLVGTNTESIVAAVTDWSPPYETRKAIFGNGKTSHLISNNIERIVSNKT